jgi:hypothetical protein
MLRFTQPVEETVGDLEQLLGRMGCDLNAGGVAARFERTAEHYDGEYVFTGTPAFRALAGAATSALLWRDNSDVLMPLPPQSHDDNSAATATLLRGFMGALGNGTDRQVNKIVSGEIKYQQGRFMNKGSYSAVGAVKYCDRVLDELDLTRPTDRIARVLRSLRAIRTFRGGIYA